MYIFIGDYISPLSNFNIIGGLNMKRIYITLFISSLFCTLTVLSAEVKERVGDDFLRINDNIQNDELRVELEKLREEFILEKARILEYYNEKIESLKENRRGEIKTIKKSFAGRREVLMKKYDGKLQKKSKIRSAEPVNNTPFKKKVTPKDKKRLRKSK